MNKSQIALDYWIPPFRLRQGYSAASRANDDVVAMTM
jgi:hypothetical protein